MRADGRAWSGTVVKKSRGLLDGANLYRRLEVRLDDGEELEVRVPRGVWDEVRVGDRLVKPAGGSARRG
ncbi:hypothetical protein ACTOB_003401 [Actinoplanes oblitus]|uniref:DUF7489 domain-containing protein n=1 Tax=Actinoplanes oblitus TaxID=3040509 RepID=A0ABY8WS97_9ACTN|nr:hypothetical protein [Actinoplanes oblitus]WIM99740.1 hypothetical protein ACTOB_003401 [Actinoplanes oblitus]